MLTALKVKQARPGPKRYKLWDEKGLYLEVQPNGSKYWRYKFRLTRGENRIEKLLALGVYPEISLSKAREKLHSARQLVAIAKDPTLEKAKAKRLAAVSHLTSFGAIGKNWFKQRANTWSKTHCDRQRRLFFVDLLPLHDTPISELTGPEIKACYAKMEARGIYESIHRANYIAKQIFDQAIALDLTISNPAEALKKTLTPGVSRNYAAATSVDGVKAIVQRIWDYPGSTLTRSALRLLPMLLVRTSELRKMEWEEIREDGVWCIPAQKMKRNRDHLVPLPLQAKTVLEGLRDNKVRSISRYVFPNTHSALKPMSNNTILQAFRACGVTREEASPHGFRASGRTILAEVFKYRIDWIEHQLAHKVRDPNGTAYNRTEFLNERRAMLQAWADLIVPDLEAN
jgi:integrase